MPLRIIYLIAFLEGFSTLAVEIVAMRIAIPVVGSSIVLTSVFLGVVLLALSAGYRSGGVVSSKMDNQKRIMTLAGALLFAGVRYVSISFAWERQFLEIMMENTSSYIFTLFVVAFGLFFLPVFVASHTIPLLTDLLDEPSKGKAAGIVLFASTVGSFFGSTVTSIVLFEWIGVGMTGALVGSGLIFLAAFVFRRQNKYLGIISLIIGISTLGWSLLKNGESSLVYSFDSAYQKIDIYDAEYQGDPIRVFSTNGALSSAIFLDEGDTEAPFKYINEILRISDIVEPKSVLVIGAAGFVYPQLLSSRKYVDNVVAVDIDASVKDIAEKYFLEESLNEKIEFIPRSARGVIHEYEKTDVRRFDLIFLDAYNDKSVPEELVTKEFFDGIQNLLGDDGVMIANMILDPGFESDFAQSSLSTMRATFDSLWANNVTTNVGSYLDNHIISSRPLEGYSPVDVQAKIYTDDRSSAGIDNVGMLYFQELKNEKK